MTTMNYQYTKPVYMRILKDKGLTNGQIAKIVGVTDGCISKHLIQDKTHPAYEVMCKNYVMDNYQEKETSVKAVSNTVTKQVGSSDEPATFLVVVAKSKEAFVRKVINSVGGICE